VSAVQSVERAFAIVGCLAGGPAGVSEIAERVDLPKSTVSRLLVTLVELGVVEQPNPGSGYRLGAYLHSLAGATQPVRRLIDLSRPHLAELVNATHEAAGLSVLEDDEALYLDQVSSPGEIRIRDWTGERIKAHLVSSGLVLLAESGDAAIDQYLARPLERQTARTMTDPEALRRRLEEVRERGVAWVVDELVDGLSSVAAPIRDGEGRAIAAIHVHGPSFRFPGPSKESTVSQLLTAAARISKSFA
jgi:IclR family transcriptional regulator, acetate operon repressor